ncbi:MAG TPA: TRC40/GET3/ArsA family transport-energizing ATPase [Vicinamibacterales bacterium]|nr:TRC40/GET3/ArsA family transport-energizing ATPase [Vicinamibacterales bacterium]
MRILLYSGKGGVGKTSLAAATGVQLARLGMRTLVMSVDPAHSLADAFDLRAGLFDAATADPYEVRAQLWVQEVNIQVELKRHWREIAGYLTTVLRTSGLGDVEAEEMAILPGMEELSAMLYVNQYRKQATYDVIVLDCAPTAESLRFVSMPTTLDWYMKHVFPMERRVLNAVRPIVNRMSPVELPADSYFANIKELFAKLDGIDTVLQDPQVTSVRLVSNAERMVLRETQRAYVYFLLHGLSVDGLIANRVLPEAARGSFLNGLRDSQQRVLAEMHAYFAPVPVRQVPMFDEEVVGLASLDRLADLLHDLDPDPMAVTRTERPFVFDRRNGTHQVRVAMPFAGKGEVGLFKKGDELVVEVGVFRRHIGLPTTLAAREPVRATFEGNTLVIELGEPR